MESHEAEIDQLAEKKQLCEEKEILLLRIAHLERINEKSQVELERVQKEKREIERSFDMRISEKISTHKSLKESLESVISERDVLRQDLEYQKDESEKLILDVEELERTNEENLTEARELRRERDSLVKEKRERERQLDSMQEDSGSIISSLLVSNADLVERMERKSRAEEKDKRIRAFSVLKKIMEKMRRLREGKTCSGHSSSLLHRK